MTEMHAQTRGTAAGIGSAAGLDRDAPLPGSVDALVVGAGMAGLAAADVISRAGRSVVVIEASPGVGGLARSTLVGGEPVEAYYHHVFPQDRETIELVDRLGMSDRLEWLAASMGILHDGRLFAFDTVGDLLRFSPLSIPGRLRMGAATGAQLVRPDRGRLDRSPVSVEGPRWFGGRGYDVLWRPLLEAKFGPDADRVAMAWLVARIRQRAGGRRETGDRLGYVRGSLGALAGAYARHLEAAGVAIRTSASVRAIRHEDRALIVDVDAEAGATIRAGAVVAALGGPALARVADLPDDYRRAVGAIPYRGIACVLVQLDRPVSDRYWINVTDRLGLGCVAIIEHTNLVDATRYGGRHLLYLAHYVGREDAAWTASAAELISAAALGIRAVNPRFSEDWILDATVARDPFAQPVPVAGGPMPGLRIETGTPGLFHASLAHVYPDDRGVAKALGLGARAGAAAIGHLGASGPRPARVAP